MRYIVAIWSLITFLFALSTTPAAAEISKVRGTRVNMESPDDFKPAANFSGFVNDPKHASLMVTEFPIPFEAATDRFNEAALLSKGMKLLSKETIQTGAYPGLLMEARQTAYGSEFGKWMNIFGDKNTTVLVTATFPVAEADSLSKRLKDAVLSARFDAQVKALDPMEDLPYTVSGTTSLKIAGRLQSTLFLNPSGNLPPPPGSSDVSTFVIGQALSDMDVGDKTDFARQRLKKIENLSDLQILEERDVTVGGMPAREILASATAKSGQPLFLLQTIAYGRGSYFVLQGMTEMSTRTRMEYEFHSIINSLKLKSAMI